jgi:hypothetical protein
MVIVHFAIQEVKVSDSEEYLAVDCLIHLGGFFSKKNIVPGD